ncbi:MAG: rod shape-determining protein MreC [Gammaproteobacteria bacterium]|nr:rod shape-determining protein MreC [Gammaproteobacteria bacterium]
MITVFGKPLRGPTPLTRLVLLATLSAALMMLDHRSNYLKDVRAGLMVLLHPLQVVASLPVSLYNGMAEFLTTGTTLRQERDQLNAERQQLLTRLQQLDSLEAENARLRAMIGSSARVADRALAADLVHVNLEPFARRLMLRRGAHDGAYIGQPVIDAHGIVGQITVLGERLSTVTLITDPGHAIPVLDNRSGLRAMVFGSGDHDSLTVPYLTAVADIQEGDLLVSSGLGGTFPAGYPVAYVTKIENDPGESYLIISARPAAQINHGKQLLLIWPGQKLELPPADDDAPPVRGRKK